jgi:peptidyl-prolyl cis-trans isomerase-like 4
MSVLIETSKGDIVVDLYYEKCPKACQNFISLCLTKYYNNCVFFNVQKNFIVQTGDPTNTGTGGHSIYHLLDQLTSTNKLTKEVYFSDEVYKDIRHNRKGLLCMANKDKPNTNASQFYFTTTDRHLDYLDDKHTIFGEIAEGLEDVLMDKINNAFTDADGKPYQVIRIKHTHVLFNPWEENPLPNLSRLIPASSPEPTKLSIYEKLGFMLGEDDDLVTNNTTEQSVPKTQEEVEQELKLKEGRSRAVVLEMIGDLPDAEVKPPENVLFVRRLNKITTDDDLALIFSRFGKINSCEIIRDHKTGESLCYGFIEFDSVEPCELAYLKMQNTVIDDRKIFVDFSQSVSKLYNRHYSKGHNQRRNVNGVKDHITSNEDRDQSDNRDHGRRDYGGDRLEYKTNTRTHPSSSSHNDYVFDKSRTSSSTNRKDRNYQDNRSSNSHNSHKRDYDNRDNRSSSDNRDYNKRTDNKRRHYDDNDNNNNDSRKRSRYDNKYTKNDRRY